jgi:diguanylate cyclase (GGDEF)-like protein/PAS domain S-box-containing protein
MSLTDRADARPRAVLPRLGAAMATLGLGVGALLPLVARAVGVLPADGPAPGLWVLCVLAGLLLGTVNWVLTVLVVGSRLRVLAVRIERVARTVGDPAQRTPAPVTDLALPVGATDALGGAAAAFNSLLAALERERRFRSVVHATNDVIALLTDEGRVSFVSDSVTDVLGWSREDLLDRHVGELLFPEDDHLFTDTGAPITHDGEPSQVFLVRVRHAAGGARDLEISSSDRRDDPDIAALLVSARDVTERLELQRRLAHQATHDELTGLPNRAALLARGAQLLAGPVQLAVLLMDLDRFKEVNDTLGHSYGDRLLAQIGPRLAPLLREVDLVARLGGDEFAVLMPEVTPGEAAAAAARLRTAVSAPFPVDGLTLDVDVSIGVAVGCGPEEIGVLLRQADVAMYAAKERQSGVELYDPLADEHDHGRLRRLGHLRHG